MCGSVRTAPFCFQGKGNEMKKIKKIIPLLLSLVMVLGMSISVSAKTLTDFETIPQIYENQKYIMYYYDCRYWVQLFPNNANVSIIVNDTSFTITCDTEHVSMWIDDPDTNTYYDFGKTWQEVTTFGAGTSFGSYAYMVESAYNIYDSEGNLVFHVPLPNPIQAVVVLPVMIITKMKTITIMAVSCLVLLIGLVVLPKKLPLFLPR